MNVWRTEWAFSLEEEKEDHGGWSLVSEAEHGGR